MSGLVHHGQYHNESTFFTYYWLYILVYLHLFKLERAVPGVSDIEMSVLVHQYHNESLYILVYLHLFNCAQSDLLRKNTCFKFYIFQ